MKKSIFYFIFTVLLCIIQNSFGQNTTGELRGYIYDESGFPLLGATAVLDNTQKGATTNIDGLFVIKKIVPNAYNITVSYLGYESITKFNVIIKSVGNQPLTFN